jgi:hypothetical protein
MWTNRSLQRKKEARSNSALSTIGLVNPHRDDFGMDNKESQSSSIGANGAAGLGFSEFIGLERTASNDSIHFQEIQAIQAIQASAQGWWREA